MEDTNIPLINLPSPRGRGSQCVFQLTRFEIGCYMDMRVAHSYIWGVEENGAVFQFIAGAHHREAGNLFVRVRVRPRRRY